MPLANLNTSNLNSVRLNDGEELIAGFRTEMRRKRGSKPVFKIEFIETNDTVTDITDYYLSGATFEQIKERAPDEIQAGNFDIILSNHDNNFSEFVSGSFLDGLQYHGARIKIYLGFKLPDGTIDYEVQTEGIIDQLINTANSQTIFRCRDRISYILDTTLHQRPLEESPVPSGGNTGNGSVSSVETRPFSTVDQTFTLTCTIGGGSGVGKFSVVGSVSGNIGTATVGTEFEDGTVGVKFTINDGQIDWESGDIITFETRQNPEWSSENLGKIIWSILTGYNWDTNTQETWSDFVLGLDNTQSDSNADLDYDSFVQSISDLSTVGEIKGYIPYDSQAKVVLEQLILLFLGSIFTGRDGRIKLKATVPQFETVALRNFSDSKKITGISYVRSIDEIINHVTAKFKRTDVWEFSDTKINYDGIIVSTDQNSIQNFNRVTSRDFEILWFTTTGAHVETLVDRIIVKFATPPLNIDFETHLDAILNEIGDPVSVTEDKYGFDSLPGEISRITKMLDEVPKKISLRVRRDDDFSSSFGFWGSTEDEGDGLSPQDIDWDTATDEDKKFAYLSQTGGGGPADRMY